MKRSMSKYACGTRITLGISWSVSISYMTGTGCRNVHTGKNLVLNELLY